EAELLDVGLRLLALRRVVLVVLIERDRDRELVAHTLASGLEHRSELVESVAVDPRDDGEHRLAIAEEGAATLCLELGRPRGDLETRRDLELLIDDLLELIDSLRLELGLQVADEGAKLAVGMEREEGLRALDLVGVSKAEIDRLANAAEDELRVLDRDPIARELVRLD